MFRRRTEAAGHKWSKWGDPAYRAGLVYDHGAARDLAISVGAWSVAIGAWLGIGVSLLSR